MRRYFLSVLLLTVMVPAVWSQDAAQGRTSRERVNQQFDARAPGVGDPSPDIAGLNEKGEEFRLTNLKGQYSVLVFGCLT